MSIRRDVGQTGNQRNGDVHRSRMRNTRPQQSMFFSSSPVLCIILFIYLLSFRLAHIVTVSFPYQEMYEMRRVLRPVTPDSAIQLPGAGCWNKGCSVL